jgi:O-glycosyl hydrolase
MKTNQNLKKGGYLCGSSAQPCPGGDWRRRYALYLIQYLKYYQAAGIDIAYIGYQNEPDLAPAYAGMNWDATNVPGDQGDRGAIDPATPQNIDFIKNYLGPALADSGLKTRIACCDATSWDRAIIYANGVLADATAKDSIGLITGHGYYASSAGMLGANPINSAIQANKPVWQSEAAIFDEWNGSWDSGKGESSGIHWAEALWDAQVNAQVNAYFYWWGAKAYKVGGPTANSPLIKIVDNTYEPSKRLWAFANYSRFIRPGATRLDAQTGNGDLRVSAFKNTDGRYAIVVLNKARSDMMVTFTLRNATAGNLAVPYLTNETNDTAQQPNIAIEDGAFTASVPARSLVTYAIAVGRN